MASVSRRSSTGAGPVIRSAIPGGRFRNSHYSSSSAFASSTSSFSSRSSTFFQRAASPTRLNLAGSSPSPSAQSVRLCFDRPTSPSRSISVTPHGNGNHHNAVKSRQISNQKRTCMCSPTNHPGSFRCSLHKNYGSHVTASAPYSQNRLNARRSAMTNSLVRIGGVEGDLVKRALSALIRPSSHSQKRRVDFQPRPSRLSAMSKAEE